MQKKFRVLIFWFQAFIRLGAAVAPWLDKEMAKVWAPSSFLLMGLLSFLSFGVLLFLPETQGTITADAEDEDGEGGEDGRVFKSTDVDQLQCDNHNNNNNKYDNDNNNNKNDREIEIDHLESYGNNALEVTDWNKSRNRVNIGSKLINYVRKLINYAWPH